MFLKWIDAKKQYPAKWVIFKNPKYLDKFHMELIGGNFVATADTQSEMFGIIESCEADDSDIFTGKHTEEDEAVGTLMSDI